MPTPTAFELSQPVRNDANASTGVRRRGPASRRRGITSHDDIELALLKDGLNISRVLSVGKQPLT